MAKKKSNRGSIKPGEVRNPNGRPKGSRNRIQEGLLHRLADHLEKFTDSALNRMCNEEPGGYLRLAASLLPKEINVDVTVDIESGPVSELDRLLADFISNRQTKRIPKPVQNGPILPATLCIEQERRTERVDLPEVQGSTDKPEWLS